MFNRATPVTKKRTYKFDGDLLIVQQIRTFENNAKRTLSNFFPDPIVDTDNI